jgi:hypothetical protein
MHRDTTRTWIIRWLFAVAAGHVVGGGLLPWVAATPLLDAYHGGVEAAFWVGAAPDGARYLETFWLSLFGPTVQLMALWMMALIHLADQLRQPRIWLWLMAGLVVWAPQDIVVSLRAGVWSHVWVDLLVLALMLPPLFWLWRLDRASAPALPLKQPITTVEAH